MSHDASKILFSLETLQKAWCCDVFRVPCDIAFSLYQLFINNRVAGDLRRSYDVTVMSLVLSKLILCTVVVLSFWLLLQMSVTVIPFWWGWRCLYIMPSCYFFHTQLWFPASDRDFGRFESYFWCFGEVITGKNVAGERETIMGARAERCSPSWVCIPQKLSSLSLVISGIQTHSDGRTGTKMASQQWSNCLCTL